MAERCKKTILCSVSHLGFLASGLFANQLCPRFSRGRGTQLKASKKPAVADLIVREQKAPEQPKGLSAVPP